jgi:acetyl-CoA/propionyl-CoA carboxylase biotin carboxyl carrier protein
MTHEVFVNNKPHNVKVLERNGNTFLVEINGKSVRVKLNSVKNKSLMVEINGDALLMDVERIQSGLFQIKSDGETFDVLCHPRIPRETIVKSEPTIVAAKKSVGSLAIEKGAVVAPIAGRIVLLNVNVGEKVAKGNCVCVLEAMKMQNEIVASKAGVVSAIQVSEGAIVNKGDILVTIK